MAAVTNKDAFVHPNADASIGIQPSKSSCSSVYKEKSADLAERIYTTVINVLKDLSKSWWGKALIALVIVPLTLALVVAPLISLVVVATAIGIALLIPIFFLKAGIAVARSVTTLPQAEVPAQRDYLAEIRRAQANDDAAAARRRIPAPSEAYPTEPVL